MKKVFLILSIIIAAAFIAGCEESKPATTTTTVSTSEGEVDVEVSSTADSKDDWCSAGSTMKTNGPQGDVEVVIEGIVTSGKYAGYCHMTQNVQTGTDSMTGDYYYNEDGAGYQVINVNGQKIETEWTNPN